LLDDGVELAGAAAADGGRSVEVGGQGGVASIKVVYESGLIVRAGVS